MSEYNVKKIATIYNGFCEKFGIPRQSGLTSAESVICFEEQYRNADALRGLEQYSHLWLVWWFSEFVTDGWSPTVRPPRLGGNKRMGLFATRSPNRPNPIGLSVVEIVKIELSAPDGPRITVKGADLLNGTPILDIKPYIPYADSHPQAEGGFAHQHLGRELQVNIPPELCDGISEDRIALIRELLAQDPRPAYQNDPQRVYSMSYDELCVRFLVDGKELRVVEILRGNGTRDVSGT